MATTCTDAAGRRRWLLQLLVWLAVTAALVVAAYFLVDRPIAFFVRDRGLDRSHLLRWLTRPPEAFVILSPLVLLAGLLRRCFGPWTRAETVAVAMAVSTLLAALAAGLLKVTFGRPGPDLVVSGGAADGLYPFSVDPAFWALPSGHTACTVSVTAVAQAAAPGWRLCWWMLAVVVAASLVALNHHFVGDVVAGAFVGCAVGGTVARAFGFRA